MARNLVLLSDGTGNSSAKLFKTNVWRLYQILDLQDSAKQIAYYDDGVGTSSFKPLAILGGVFGVGLKRNVIDIYSFCCRNYQDGDRLFGFGFSRGAFTIRVVAGLISRIGLVPYDGNDANLARDAETAYREYRKVRDFKSGGNFFIKPLRKLRDWISHTVLRKPSFDELKPKIRPIDWFEFLGVWDTVDAYGGPIEEITRAIDYWIWPLSMPDQFMNAKIGRACHALALEDERDAFRPVLWDDRYVRDANKKLRAVDEGWQPRPVNPDLPLSDIDRERISQVWFVGVHSDVGGGYPQDGLSYKTLSWMMKRADIYGLHYLSVQESWFQSQVGPYDKLNDSRHGIGGYYRYRPRRLADIYRRPPYKLSFKQDILHVGDLLNGRQDPEREVKQDLAPATDYVERPDPKIHRSVIERIDRGTDGYAPIVLPETFGIVNEDGSIEPNVENWEPAANATARSVREEKVWDLVWARRVIYFLTVFASFWLLCLPLIEWLWPGNGPAGPVEFIVPLIDTIGLLLPNFVKPWLDAIRQSPGRFVIGAVLVALLLYVGGGLQGRIRDRMRMIWKTPEAKFTSPDGTIFGIRTSGAYVAFFYVLKHWVLPTFFAALIAVAVFVIVVPGAAYTLNRIAFTVMDATGHVCKPHGSPTPVSEAGSSFTFETATLCAATGFTIERGKTYEVSLTVTDPWIDGTIETGPEGFGAEKMSKVMWLGLPMRRLLAANWFVPILHIGHTGFGEVLLTFERVESPRCVCPPTARYKAKLKAHHNGELFVYVNDAVVGWPGYASFFYTNEPGRNKGKAELTVRPIAD